MINQNNYNLKYNLRVYNSYLDLEEGGTGFQEEKDKLAKKVMQVIALGVEKFTEDQENSLLHFIHRNSLFDSDDCVVQLASAILNLRSIPDDIKSIIESFKDVNCLNSLSETQRQKVVIYAADRILKDGEQLSCYDLAQFAKIITIGWKNLNNHQGALIGKIRKLINDVSPDHEFVVYAKALIQQSDAKYITSEIKNHPGYHGEALNFGFSCLQEVLKTTGKAADSLQDFSINYCQKILKKNEILIRNSSTVPYTDESGTKSFPMTISYKNENDKVFHVRFKCQEDKDGVINWSCMTTNNVNAYFPTIYHVFNQFSNYNVCKAPNFIKMNEFVHDHYV